MTAQPLKAGLAGEAVRTVTERDTAAALGSGLLPVFGTPALVALLEQAAVNAVAPCLEAGTSTVGAELSVSHLAPTPILCTVHAHAQLVEIDGRRLTFSCTASDEKGLIGQARQVRYIVDMARFMTKAEARRE